MNMKKIIITALLALVWVAGSSQEAENDSIPDGIETLITEEGKMKTMKIWRVAFVMTFALLSLASCSSDDSGDTPILIIDPVEVDLEKPTATTTLSLSNAPIIDGSDSTEPLRNLLMCRLLGIDCQWLQRLETDGTWCVEPQWHSLSNEDNKTLQHIL